LAWLESQLNKLFVINSKLNEITEDECMGHKISLSTMFVAIGLTFSASIAMAADEAKADAKEAPAATAKADAKEAPAAAAKEAPAAGGDARATMLAYTCAGCHGTNGVSTGPAIPTIAGMAEDTFTDAMVAYKDKEGGKNATIMGRIAAGYSDEDIAAMAGFFSKQKFVAAKQDFDAAKAEAGKKIHEAQCKKCHEEGGTKDIDGSSILAGQWKPYTHYTLTDVLSGDRTVGKKMAKKVKAAHAEGGDDAITALVEYYASQQ
jgi:sulfide dehydrogenase cytochrome subunit